MSVWLNASERARTRPALGLARSPIPMQIVSNGEYNPPRQSEQQREVERVFRRSAARRAHQLGMSPDVYLSQPDAMATAFGAMNSVYGESFRVGADERDGAPHYDATRDQLIVDGHLHFVCDEIADLPEEERWPLSMWMDWASSTVNPTMLDDVIGRDIERYKFDNFVKEVFLDSDTSFGGLTGAPNEPPTPWLQTNDQIRAACDAVNEVAGSRRLFGHAVITPGKAGWLDEVDRAIEELQPSAWKGYTIGSAVPQSPYPYRLDDEELMYPFYERISKAGITTVCMHKGLLAESWQEMWPDLWKYANVDDVPKAAKDWPGLNFVIFHAGYRPFFDAPGKELEEFERTGYIQWVTDLAEIPEKHGVSNVYGEIAQSFANSVITHPRMCAALLGTLIRGLGADRVLWGTDSVFSGSPQWQIEAFRRLEIPDDMQRKFGFAALGEADGEVKSTIFGRNWARLLGIEADAERERLSNDQIGEIRRRYLESGGRPSNLRYGLAAN